MAEHFALKNNQIFVLAEAAGGVYNSDQLRILCEVADSESAFLKITEDQRLGFMIDPAKLPDVQAQVRKSGLLLRSYKASGVPSPRACLGELCTFAQQPSLGDALELTTHLLKSFPSPKRYSSIGVNGCGRACLGSSTEDIHVVAEESGYKISIGGKGSDISQQAQLILENVPRAELPLVIEKILAVFYQESLDGERIFDVVDRVGLTPFFNALPEHLVPTVPESPAEEIVQETVNADSLIAQAELTENSAESSSDSSGLVAGDQTDLLIDDLLESSSSEFAADALGTGLAETSTDGLDAALLNDEPIVDIEVPSLNSEFNAMPDMEASVATPETPLENVDDQARSADAESETEAETETPNELLEEAEFEDGTLEDVERVRDAIRTELSMSPSAEGKDAAKHSDLLDELESGAEADVSSMDDISEEGFDSLAEQDEFSEPFVADESLASEESDDFSGFEEHTAASVEHQVLSKPRRQHSKVSSSSTARPKSAPAPVQAVSGRLAIKFLGEQLGVELPSGMCFELPFDAVPEGAEFSMLLPDGELKMQRLDGMLNVNLGMLNMRFPIPQLAGRRVA